MKVLAFALVALVCYLGFVRFLWAETNSDRVAVLCSSEKYEGVCSEGQKPTKKRVAVSREEASPPRSMEELYAEYCARVLYGYVSPKDGRCTQDHYSH